MIAWSFPCSAGFTIRGEHAAPSGRPVLHFLHGNGYCGRVYWPMLSLLQADFDIVISDIQGHGDTAHGGRFHGWNRTAELALEAWHKLAPRFPDVPHYALGHSFGGVITSLMLAQEPQQFRRAMLLDPVLFTPIMIGVMALSDVVGLYQRNTMAKAARSRRRHWVSRVEAYASLQGRGMFKGWTPEALQAYVEFALKDSPAVMGLAGQSANPGQGGLRRRQLSFCTRIGQTLAKYQPAGNKRTGARQPLFHATTAGSSSRTYPRVFAGSLMQARHNFK
jgi:pimeloyl-ACP methyl ester carboxylesterase